jgi:uroporphyrin-III C-methyltransferase
MSEVNMEVAKPATSPGIFARITLTQLTLIVLTVVFLAQWLLARHDITTMQTQLAEKLATIKSDEQVNDVLLKKTQEETRELTGKVALLEAHNAESQSQRAALESLYNELASSRDETALAEVEQSLLIANQQLQLSANVKAALIAMQTADARLQRMNRPALNSLRKSIALEMETLRALPNVDMTEVSAQLDLLAISVDELPLWSTPQTAPPLKISPDAPKEQSSWQALLTEVWQELRQLIRIQNTAQTQLPVLPPEQEFFLHENLKLRLLLARMDLQARDETAFKSEVNAMQQWVQDYFVNDDERTQQVSSSLKKLASTRITIEIPDLNASLTQVRSYRLSHDKDARTNNRTE